MVSGLTAKCGVLRLVEGHLAPHLSDLTRLTEADVGLDAHHFRIWDQQLPHARVVAAPAAGRGDRWDGSTDVRADARYLKTT